MSHASKHCFSKALIKRKRGKMRSSDTQGRLDTNRKNRTTGESVAFHPHFVLSHHSLGEYRSSPENPSVQAGIELSRLTLNWKSRRI